MAERYIVFDVETPNSYNHRMSAIGITVVDNGNITDSFYSLVNPDTHFDRFNIQLTGITPQMVETAPNFTKLWETIEPIMASGVLVAHNARFDMGVLSKCLQSYNISWKPSAVYACTCVMGRKCYPQFPSHKLNTMCALLGIELDHHRADSDSEACAKLLIDYMEHGLDVGSFLRTYCFQ